VKALACGKPVVAGTSGGTGETMRVPDTGRLVGCESPHELAVVVTELMKDAELRSRMGDAARRWVVERFDWQIVTRQAEQLFGFLPSEQRYFPGAVDS
jgi:phosphatidylinositol alpha-1,6-mannosyltransferase